MRLSLTVLVLFAGLTAQATEVYKCSLQQLKVSKTSISVKAKPDSKESDFYLVDGKKTTQIEAVQAKMRDGVKSEAN